MLPSLSVIVSVRNQRAMLPRLLDQLIRQHYPASRYEILVVDSASTDGSADLIRRRFARGPVRVRVLDNPKGSLAAGRNAAINVSTGDVLLFMEGNSAIHTRNFLEDAASTLDRTGAVCLAFPQPLSAPPATHTGEVVEQLSTHWLLRGRLPAVADTRQAGFVDPVCGGSGYLRRVFYRVGLFDESMEACAEAEFNLRVRQAGLRAWSDPHLTVEQAPQNTLGELFRQMAGYGRGRWALVRRHSDCFAMGDLAPLGPLAAVLLAVAGWVLLPRGWAMAGSVPAAALLLALAAGLIQVFVQYGIATAVAAPLVVAAAWIGTGLGLLREMIAPAQRREPASVPGLPSAEAEARGQRSDRAA